MINIVTLDETIEVQRPLHEVFAYVSEFSRIEEWDPDVALKVWEYAYYLDYQNKRDAYIEEYLANLINWEFAASNFGAERAAA